MAQRVEGRIADLRKKLEDPVAYNVPSFIRRLKNKLVKECTAKLVVEVKMNIEPELGQWLAQRSGR